MTGRIGLGLLLACVPLAGAGGGEPSIPNGGFEAGDGGSPGHWGWWSRDGGGSATRTGVDAPEGGHAVAIVHHGGRDWAFSSAARQRVRPGDAFRVSASVKVGRGHVVLAVVALHDGELVAWDIGSAGCGPGELWRTIDAVAEVPDGCNEIYLRFVGEGATVAWLDDVRIESIAPEPAAAPKPPVDGHAPGRVREPMGRAPVALRCGDGRVHLGWRLLATDPPGAGFDVHRRVGGGAPGKLNDRPVTRTTDFVDTTAPAGTVLSYQVCPAGAAVDDGAAASVTVPADESAPFIRLPLRDRAEFRKVGVADLDGDGRYDFVVKHPAGNVDPYVEYWERSPDTFKLDAYTADGRFLWRHDLGWSIERGIWYSPFLVFDLDGDGRAEVAVKTGEGDPRDPDGRVQSGPEHLTILDGLTGRVVTRVDWPPRELFSATSRPYNYASRNQLGVAFLDGRTPCLLVERGTYNTIVVVAYELHGGSLRRLWTWDNRRLGPRFRGQGAHWMHSADVDGDGRDEVVIGSVVIDDNGEALWSTGLGHPDHAYLGDLDPSRPGLEIYYGIETARGDRNGMCMVDAATGEIIWGHQGATRHVHGSGMCSDIDASHPGAECYSADTDERKRPAWARLRTATGETISDELAWEFGPHAVHWDADLQREILWKGRISDFRGGEHAPRIEGSVVAVADILGDWREEVIVSCRGELRIYSTTVPAADRRPCLMLDPLYRTDVAHAAMGYTQVPMPGRDLAAGRPGDAAGDSR